MGAGAVCDAAEGWRHGATHKRQRRMVRRTMPLRERRDTPREFLDPVGVREFLDRIRPSWPREFLDHRQVTTGIFRRKPNRITQSLACIIPIDVSVDW